MTDDVSTRGARSTAVEERPGPPPHALPVDEVLKGFGTDPERGLTAAEATRRVEESGPNELPEAPSVPSWRRFLTQFKDVLVVLLLAATAVSLVVWVLEGADGLPLEAIVIVGIVVFNAVLGWLQEERAEQAVAALRAMTVPGATVVRAGERLRIASSEVAPGDLLLVEEGDAIAADGRLLDVVSLRVSEAALTGESEPVAKDIAPVETGVATADQTNMVFMGTVATFGRGRAVVTSTGERTQMGRIATMLEQAPARRTPLQVEIARVGRALGIAVVAIAVIVVGTILLTNDIDLSSDLVAVLLLGVSLAVAAVPEGLATVLTVVLALGVQRMAGRNAIVKRLSAVETLGSASVIGTDKTGTLTRNEMTVRAVLCPTGRVELTGSGYDPAGEALHDGRPLSDDRLGAELRATLAAAAVATNASLDERDGTWSIQGDPTEAALIVAARKVGAEVPPRSGRLGEVPFSSERKLMTVVHPGEDGADRLATFTKGAPDVLLERCAGEQVAGVERPLTAERRREIAAAVEGLATEALRTIGVARGSTTREGTGAAGEDGDVERDLVLLGVVGMMDPPRPESRPAVETAHGAGIRVIMITGDHPATAKAIARELGIGRDLVSAMTGSELQHLEGHELLQAVRDADVFARVSPEHKLRIVEALEGDGEVVAMTGDGVNDAPALKSADIGIAMGIAGTEVSKQAADLILTDDHFATIVAAVEEGRAIFSNIRKFIRYLLSSNVGEVLTVFLGVVLAGTIGLVTLDEGFATPLLATQILWINLLTDAAPALALGVDPVAPGLMQRPPRSRAERLIDRPMWLTILVVGSAMAAATLLTLDLALPGGMIEGDRSLVEGRTLAFTVLVLAQLFNVFNSRSAEASAFGMLFTNPWAWGAVGLSAALQLVVVYVPFFNRAFGTVPIGAVDWAICVAMASLVLWVAELWKLLKRARRSTRPASA